MLEKHHIIFRSSGGLDFPLNYKYLDSNSHRGDNGPHKNREVDLQYKRELETDLLKILTKDYYTADELIELLELESRQAYKAFKKVKQSSKGIAKEDVIKRLLGGKFYL